MSEKSIRIIVRMILGIITLALLLYFGYDQWDNVKDPRTLTLYFLILGGNEGVAEMLSKVTKHTSS